MNRVALFVKADFQVTPVTRSTRLAPTVLHRHYHDLPSEMDFTADVLPSPPCWTYLSSI